MKNCSKIIYLQSNFVVEEKNAEKLMERVDAMLKLNMMFSGKVFVGDQDHPQTKKLSDLTAMNI